jgi:hypothetical protein
VTGPDDGTFKRNAKHLNLMEKLENFRVIEECHASTNNNVETYNI